MKIGNVDTREKVLVIAEIGNNHEGKFANAQKMVRAAAASGADAVKFQTFKAEHFNTRENKERFARLKGFELTQDKFVALGEIAREEGLLFISTPLDLGSARFLSSHVDALKVASCDNNFYPMLELVAQSGKPLILSCGLVDLELIRTAVQKITEVWDKAGSHPDLALLHCVSSYPVPVEQANLSAIRTLLKEFDCTIGYSDHTLGIDAAVLSVAMGARIVEKHFTLDKNYSDFRDHQLAADPEDMRVLVEKIRVAERMLGSGDICVAECEAAGVEGNRRSIAVIRDLASEHTLAMEDLIWIRPGGGIPPGDEYKIVGKTLNVAVSEGDRLDLSMFQNG